MPVLVGRAGAVSVPLSRHMAVGDSLGFGACSQVVYLYGRQRSESDLSTDPGGRTPTDIEGIYEFDAGALAGAAAAAAALISPLPQDDDITDVAAAAVPAQIPANAVAAATAPASTARALDGGSCVPSPQASGKRSKAFAGIRGGDFDLLGWERKPPAKHACAFGAPRGSAGLSAALATPLRPKRGSHTARQPQGGRSGTPVPTGARVAVQARSLPTEGWAWSGLQHETTRSTLKGQWPPPIAGNTSDGVTDQGDGVESRRRRRRKETSVSGSIEDSQIGSSLPVCTAASQAAELSYAASPAPAKAATTAPTPVADGAAEAAAQPVAAAASSAATATLAAVAAAENAAQAAFSAEADTDYRAGRATLVEPQAVMSSSAELPGQGASVRCIAAGGSAGTGGSRNVGDSVDAASTQHTSQSNAVRRAVSCCRQVKGSGSLTARDVLEDAIDCAGAAPAFHGGNGLGNACAAGVGCDPLIGRPLTARPSKGRVGGAACDVGLASGFDGLALGHGRWVGVGPTTGIAALAAGGGRRGLRGARVSGLEWAGPAGG